MEVVGRGADNLRISAYHEYGVFLECTYGHITWQWWHLAECF